jgi:hypothetical protein
LSTIKVNTIENRTGSSITIGGSSTTSLDLASTITGGTLTNTPSFGAQQSGSQSISNDANVKLQCDTENWDTDSAYDNSTNYRFTVPSGKGGKYYIQAHIQIPGIDANEFGQIMLYKNGSVINEAYVREQKASADRIFQMITAITYSLAEGDYIEVYVYQNSGDAQNATNGYFTAHKLIGV